MFIEGAGGVSVIKRYDSGANSWIPIGNEMNSCQKPQRRESYDVSADTIYAAAMHIPPTKVVLNKIVEANETTITLAWQDSSDEDTILHDDETVTITATVTPSSGTDHPTGTVTFKNRNRLLKNAQVPIVNGQAVWTGTLEAIPHSITAEYCGNELFGKSTSSAMTDIDVHVAPMTGSGTETDPYLIMTTGQLRNVTQEGKYYKLGTDLDFTYYYDNDLDASNGICHICNAASEV